jgi:hypothetical protein
MDEADMAIIAGLIVGALRGTPEPSAIEAMMRHVKDLCRRYPVPGITAH